MGIADELKQVFDIIGITVHKTRTYQNQMWINCPFPHAKGRDKFPSMSVKDVEDNYLFYCTACKYKGNVYSLLNDYKGKNENDYLKIKSILVKDFNYYLSKEHEVNLPVKHINNYIEKANNYYNDCISLPNEAFNFYKDKAIEDETLLIAKAKFNPIKNRIAFPVFSMANKLVGINERAISKNDRLKWNILYSFPKTEYVYFLDISEDIVFICEGIGDVLRMYQNGYSAVGVFGSSISERQIELLAFINKKYYILFDGDQAGYEGTKQAIKKIGNRLFVSWLFCPQNKDPGSLNRIDIEKLIERNKK